MNYASMTETELGLRELATVLSVVRPVSYVTVRNIINRDAFKHGRKNAGDEVFIPAIKILNALVEAGKLPLPEGTREKRKANVEKLAAFVAARLSQQ